MEYVALAVATADDIVKQDEVITVLRLLVVLLLMVVLLLAVDEDVDVCDVVLATLLTPTQYA
jgi:hypothetical protein